MSETQDRTAAQKGLTALAEQASALEDLHHFLVKHPDLNYSWLGGTTVYVGTPHPVDEDGITNYDVIDVAGVAQQVRIMKDGGKVEKRSSDDYMTYTRRFEGSKAQLQMSVPRKSVCEAVVTGQETVIHAPVYYQPARQETRDVIEWVCSPLLQSAEDDGDDA
jgi:hypothetical protein